jgi:CRP/FNR family transcriptional regulator, dissimilatory nitrate respiration regulator
MQQGLVVRDVPANGNGNGTARDPRVLEGVLSNLPLFSGIGQRRIAEIAGRSRGIHFRRGATVCDRGACLSGLYAIAYGQVKLAFRGDSEERVTRIAGPVEMFGLAASILGRPTPYEAVALEDSLLIVVPSTTVLQIVENDPRFARAVILELAERTMTLLAEVESGALHRGAQRLAAYLEALAGAPVNDACIVHLPTTKTVIAARLGIKKETLSRLLRGLVQKGLISVEQRAISILDRRRLSALARETL